MDKIFEGTDENSGRKEQVVDSGALGQELRIG